MVFINATREDATFLIEIEAKEKGHRIPAGVRMDCTQTVNQAQTCQRSTYCTLGAPST